MSTGQNVDMVNNENVDVEEGKVFEVQKAIGVPKHPIWEAIFNRPYVHCINKPNQAICKHCRQSVSHHHKTLSVQGHLRKREQFNKLMSDMVVSDLPHWWKTGINVSWAVQKPKMTAITSSKFSLLNQSQK